ncbi:hypothetical protein DFJ58DRAFT_793310 [Suillus subalutaceus]|uniref:uncharacterized protein n=1 Tax=Suillus subalutaceus TaxID=48586 RepID=UPI001B863056|nr:uncharacterized protein DFJ58DRAFT_793310 [Suillus subalutaceus]KAG1850851.1 hypothetical protein DFJ58DRAFT_793310 [Suillus subalutaceus]
MSSNKGGPNPYNNGAPPKYLNDFSKALASEVRILLAEVGKLRDERRQLQFEIAELMAVKSKHGAGGEYSPDWGPPPQEPPPPPPPAASPPPEEGLTGPARPAWRVVHKPQRREKPAPKSLPAPAPFLRSNLQSQICPHGRNGGQILRTYQHRCLRIHFNCF